MLCCLTHDNSQSLSLTEMLSGSCIVEPKIMARHCQDNVRAGIFNRIVHDSTGHCDAVFTPFTASRLVKKS